MFIEGGEACGNDQAYWGGGGWELHNDCAPEHPKKIINDMFVYACMDGVSMGGEGGGDVILPGYI
jgi:hypothetical protein